MSWLNDWLKQLILIVLLASFIDLLLPSQAMQRYVRTVVGLFLLLALLTPAFQWFQKGWDADKWLAAAVNSIEARSALAADGRQKPDSLPAIMEKSDELKRSNEQTAVKLTDERLAEDIRAGLEKTLGASVADIQVRTNLDNKGRPFIEKMEVVLSYTAESRRTDESRNLTGTTPAGRVKIEEIKPVAIRVGPVNSDKNAKPAAASIEDSPEAEQLKRDAIRLIQRDWNVPAERIAVLVRGPEQTRR